MYDANANCAAGEVVVSFLLSLRLHLTMTPAGNYVSKRNCGCAISDGFQPCLAISVLQRKDLLLTVCQPVGKLYYICVQFKYFIWSSILVQLLCPKQVFSKVNILTFLFISMAVSGLVKVPR